MTPLLDTKDERLAVAALPEVLGFVRTPELSARAVTSLLLKLDTTDKRMDAWKRAFVQANGMFVLAEIGNRLEDRTLSSRVANHIVFFFNSHASRPDPSLFKLLLNWKWPDELGASVVEPLIGALQNETWLVRKAAAETLVKLYCHQGRLEDRSKRAILAQKGRMNMRHKDSTRHGDNGEYAQESHGDTEDHTDSGIEVKL